MRLSTAAESAAWVGLPAVCLPAASAACRFSTAALRVLARPACTSRRAWARTAGGCPRIAYASESVITPSSMGWRSSGASSTTRSVLRIWATETRILSLIDLCVGVGWVEPRGTMSPVGKGAAGIGRCVRGDWTLFAPTSGWSGDEGCPVPEQSSATGCGFGSPSAPGEVGLLRIAVVGPILAELVNRCADGRALRRRYFTSSSCARAPRRTLVTA